MKHHSYKNLLRMKKGEEAVELLFKRAQDEYLELFQEMIEQEKEEQTLKKAFGQKKAKGVIYDSFTKEASIKKNIDLFKNTANVLGKENVIKNHENMFFDLLFYKFCEDYKYYHQDKK